MVRQIKNWIKKTNMINNRTVARVFEELDAYREFCVEYGFIFNEKDLYKRNTAYGQFERAKRGDRVVNNWVEDAAAFIRNTKH